MKACGIGRNSATKTLIKTYTPHRIILLCGKLGISRPLFAHSTSSSATTGIKTRALTLPIPQCRIVLSVNMYISVSHAIACVIFCALNNIHPVITAKNVRPKPITSEIRGSSRPSATMSFVYFLFLPHNNRGKKHIA